MSIRSLIWFLLILSFGISSPGFAQEALHFSPVAALGMGIDFTVTPMGMIYAIDGATSEVKKISIEGEILKQTGGFGWDAGLFDSPIAVYSNILSVFVTDKNNHRVQQFDKDLNYAGSLQTTPSGQTNFSEIRYPVDCIVSPQGDYLILDSDNKRIVKFDPFGNFIMEFGGVNWGNYSLQSPRRLIPLEGDAICVMENSRLLFFTSFGTGTGSYSLPSNTGSVCMDNGTVYCSSGKILLKRKVDSSTDAWITYDTDIPDVILKIEVKSGILYVLTAKGIYKSTEKI